MKKKLTPWFDGSVKPVHVGVYERNYAYETVGLCRWDGRSWKCSHDDVKSADADTTGSILQNLPWRGLAVKP